MGEVGYLQKVLSTDTPLLSQLKLSEPPSTVTNPNYCGPCTQIVINDSCNLILKSMYVYGKRDGIATLVNEDYEVLMELPFKNGKLNGKVVIHCLQMCYMITYYEGNPTGEVTVKNQDSYYFVGDVCDGMANGNGTFYLNNGDKYVGLFQKGVANGYGRIWNKNEILVIDGIFKNGKLSSYSVEAPLHIAFVRNCVKPQKPSEQPVIISSKSNLEFEDYMGITECEVEMARNKELTLAGKFLPHMKETENTYHQLMSKYLSCVELWKKWNRGYPPSTKNTQGDSKSVTSTTSTASVVSKTKAKAKTKTKPQSKAPAQAQPTFPNFNNVQVFPPLPQNNNESTLSYQTFFQNTSDTATTSKSVVAGHSSDTDSDSSESVVSTSSYLKVQQTIKARGALEKEIDRQKVKDFYDSSDLDYLYSASSDEEDRKGKKNYKSGRSALSNRRKR